MGGPYRPRVLAIAESDSYLAWAAGMLSQLPENWDVDRMMLRYSTNPTPTQMNDLLGASGALQWPQRTLRNVVRSVRSREVDVVLLACTGPLVSVLSRVIRAASPRALLMNGIPGIAEPIPDRALRARTGIDVFITHSLSEQRLFSSGFRSIGSSTTVALATLPDLVRIPTTVGVEPFHVTGPVLFADQALVPHGRRARRDLVCRLAELPVEEVVVKERSRSGEPSTHRDVVPLRRIYDDVCRSDRSQVGRLRFVNGPLSSALTDVDGCLTVSSTAGLVALSHGLPTGFVADFGVSEALKNVVFEGSGLGVTLAQQTQSLRFGSPDKQWLEDHYFHDPDCGDLEPVLRDRLARGVRSKPMGLPSARSVVKAAGAGSRRGRPGLRGVR
jgi:hypothetical protein